MGSFTCKFNRQSWLYTVHLLMPSIIHRLRYENWHLCHWNVPLSPPPIFLLLFFPEHAGIFIFYLSKWDWPLWTSRQFPGTCSLCPLGGSKHINQTVTMTWPVDKYATADLHLAKVWMWYMKAQPFSVTTQKDIRQREAFYFKEIVKSLCHSVSSVHGILWAKESLSSVPHCVKSASQKNRHPL